MLIYCILQLQLVCLNGINQTILDCCDKNQANCYYFLAHVSHSHETAEISKMLVLDDSALVTQNILFSFKLPSHFSFALSFLKICRWVNSDCKLLENCFTSIGFLSSISTRLDADSVLHPWWMLHFVDKAQMWEPGSCRCQCWHCH